MILLNLCSKALDKEGKEVYLEIQIPCPFEAINNGMQKAGIVDVDDCGIDIVRCDPISWNVVRILRKLVSSEIDFTKLCRISEKLEGLSKDDIKLYESILQIHPPGNLEELIGLFSSLEKARSLPQIKTAEELGKYLVEERIVNIPTNLIKYIDFQKVGEERLKSANCKITKIGYVEA